MAPGLYFHVLNGAEGKLTQTLLYPGGCVGERYKMLRLLAAREQVEGDHCTYLKWDLTKENEENHVVVARKGKLGRGHRMNLTQKAAKCRSSTEVRRMQRKAQVRAMQSG